MREISRMIGIRVKEIWRNFPNQGGITNTRNHVVNTSEHGCHPIREIRITIPYEYKKIIR